MAENSISEFLRLNFFNLGLMTIEHFIVNISVLRCNDSGYHSSAALTSTASTTELNSATSNSNYSPLSSLFTSFTNSSAQGGSTLVSTKVLPSIISLVLFPANTNEATMHRIGSSETSVTSFVFAKLYLSSAFFSFSTLSTLM